MTANTARVALALALLSGVAHADIDKAGTTAANFLSVGSGAGVLGMGGAVLGLGRDLNAAAWNPGALGWMNETQFVLSHSGLADEQAQEWLGAGGRLGGSTRWALTGLYHGQGSFEGRDATGASTGSFNVSSMAFGAQVAQNFSGRGTVGLGVKYVSEDLGTVRGSGVTFDVGAMLQAGRLGFGVAAQNVSGSMKYEGASYPFPTSYGMGASLSIPEQGLRIALDANFPEAYYSDVRGGVEWMWRDQFALRAGYRAEMGADSGEPLSGPSFGMGAGIGGLWFDYGYLISGMGDGGEHRMGMTLRPGGFGSGAFGQASHDGADATAQRARDQARAEEAKAAEKAEAERTRAAMREAQKAEAAKLEAQKAEAAKAEAAKLEAQKAEAVKAEAAKLEAQKAEAAKAEAAKLEAQKAEAAKAQAAKLEAQKAEAVKAEAAKAAEDAAPKKIPTQHRVSEGETLYRISKMYGTTVPKIMELNNMVNETIHVGQVLKLPKPETR